MCLCMTLPVFLCVHAHVLLAGRALARAGRCLKSARAHGPRGKTDHATHCFYIVSCGSSLTSTHPPTQLCALCCIERVHIFAGPGVGHRTEARSRRGGRRRGGFTGRDADGNTRAGAAKKASAHIRRRSAGNICVAGLGEKVNVVTCRLIGCVFCLSQRS